MGAFFLKSYFENFDFNLGSDEVGRGCVAGPVVCCTIKVLCTRENYNRLIGLRLKDSKKLSKKRRALIVDEILGHKLYLDARYLKGRHSKNYFYSYSIWPGLEACISVICPRFIDRNYILKASLYGMKVSGSKLLGEVNLSLSGCWVFDGNQVPVMSTNEQLKVESMIQADEKLLPVSLASILAKEFRDKLMSTIGIHYPEYQFKKHVGYLTKVHQEALRKYGPTDHHRLSFKGVMR